MRILLVGEYSRLHNSLKEGLLALGHEVTLVSDGDSFKNYPNDYSYRAKWLASNPFRLFRKAIHKLFKFDIIQIEQGIRFHFLLSRLKGFDVVQLINESSINTIAVYEIFLLRKLMQKNGTLYLLSSGADALSISFLLNKKIAYSILTPYLENPNVSTEYTHILKYVSTKHMKLHRYLFRKIEGVIATDFDYVPPLLGNEKYLGIIPNPINHSKIAFMSTEIKDKIVIFLGINRHNYVKKGIVYFEQALAQIRQKYGERVEIICTENIPYQEYIQLYNKAHILLDQVFAQDQGYNALEAMAKGKVVFTGAGEAFHNHYQIKNRVAFHAPPNVGQLVSDLSFLVENPQEIIEIGKNARVFIEKEHDYLKIAKKYLEVWN
ncbi:glycosyltransferase family protein [Flavobacterium sp.]|uniref:glycosyltransferase family protein n=1 Tax=Flavobacterium sp. TaxID=239 RepID=UPI002FDAD1AC